MHDALPNCSNPDHTPNRRWSRRALACVLIGAVVALTASCASAFATAGAPDPTFGTRGVVELPSPRSNNRVATEPGQPLLLADSSVLVPQLRADYSSSGGRKHITGRSIRLRWLRADGSTARTSAAIEVPVALGAPQFALAPDGHILVIGIRSGIKNRPGSLYVLRLSASGVPDGVNGGAAATTVALTAVPHFGTRSGRVDLGAIAIAPSGRVYVTLRQSYESTTRSDSHLLGPLIVAAVDPSVGLATEFATGALLLAPAADWRSDASASFTVDASGQLVTVVRSTRSAIAGKSQNVTLTRYETGGSADISFAGGVIDIDGSTIDTIYNSTPSVILARNGDILLRLDETTETNGWTRDGVELRRFFPSGQPVPGFGVDGKSTIVLRRTRTDNYSGSWFGGEANSPSMLFEQPDGKLIVGIDPFQNFGTAHVDGVFRTTDSGALDTTYERGGFARFELPRSGFAWTLPLGVDGESRAVALASTFVDEDTQYIGVVRLLGGDEPAAATAMQLRVDDRHCGFSRARACFDSDGAVHLTGRVSSGGHGVSGATVVLDVQRSGDDEPEIDHALPVARTSASGAFSIPIPRWRLLPGPWMVTGRVLATPSSQRVDPTDPVYFTLGPKVAIKQMLAVHRAQALAIVVDTIVDDSIAYGPRDAQRQCMTVQRCFGKSDELLERVSQTAHPDPGHAGLIIRKPGRYVVVTRPSDPDIDLEFVITETPDDVVYSCRGDRIARRHWCPSGTWDDIFNDAFVTAGINGAPFDY